MTSESTPARRALPPVYFLVALAAMVVLHLFVPVFTFLHAPATQLGALAVIAGLVIVIWPARDFDKAGTSIKPFEASSALITHGLYRYTRNPMYLGMVVILLGVAILFGTVSPLIVIPVFVWLITARFIRHEEADLEQAFGDDYRAYRRRVRRWL